MGENIKYVVNEEYPNKNEDERLTKFLKKLKSLKMKERKGKNK